MVQNSKHYPISVESTLLKLGRDIQGARLRRRIPVLLMSERAGISRTTLYKIERGDSGVSLGAYVTVIFVLGMIHKLRDLLDIKNDSIGLELDEEQLPKRIRLRKK